MSANRGTAVVTGGSGGIGRAIVSELASQGYRVESWSRRDGVDAGDEEQVERAAERVTSWEVLINAAAVLVPSALAETAAADWDRTLSAGLRSAFLCSRAAFRRMDRGGSIVNVSSLSGVAGAEKFPAMSAYVAAKSGLAGLTEALAVEGRPLRIRVNAISPGAVDAPMLRLASVPNGPVLVPEQVAHIAAWLAGPDSEPLSGANLRLDPA